MPPFGCEMTDQYNMTIYAPRRAPQSAAETTGGEFLRVNKGAHLPETFRGILAQYRQRYLLTYTPQGTSAPGWPCCVDSCARR